MGTVDMGQMRYEPVSDNSMWLRAGLRTELRAGHLARGSASALGLLSAALGLALASFLVPAAQAGAAAGLPAGGLRWGVGVRAAPGGTR
jgi:hypothetical protein